MEDKGSNVEGILLTIIADVFEVIPPENPSVWAQKASCVPVSISYDYEKGLYRIMCVHESRCIVNSYITTDTQFIIRTGLFGTWYDTQTDTTFGLGFRKLPALNDFSYAFTQAKKESGDSIARKVEGIDNIRMQNETAIEKHNHADNPINNNNEHEDSHSDESESWHNDDDGDGEDSNFSQDENFNLLINSPLKKKRNNDAKQERESQKHMANADIKCDYEYNVMTAQTEIFDNETTLAMKENTRLRKDLTESAKKIAEWNKKLEDEKIRNETLLKANEDYISQMDQLAHKETEILEQTKEWKSRYENSEEIFKIESDDTMIKFEQDMEEAEHSKIYYENIVEKQNEEIEDIKKNIANYSKDIENCKKTNEAVKNKEEDAFEKAKKLIEGASDQWNDMQDVETKIAESIKRLLDVHMQMKHLVEKGSSNWSNND